MTTTTRRRTAKPTKCGWCTTNKHDRCPGAVRNGDGSLTFCPCDVGEVCGVARCTRCFSRENVVDGYCADNCPALAIKDVDDEYPNKKENRKMAAAKKAAAKKATPEKAAPANGTAWLAEHVNKTVKGADYTPYQLRILLRKLAKDGRIERPEGRWSFGNTKDPNVVEIIKAIRAGEMEADKKERVEKAKAKSKPAEKAAPKKRASRKKAAPEPEPEPEDDELDYEDDDEEELELDIDED